MVEFISVLTLIVALTNFGWSLYNVKRIEDIKNQMDRERFLQSLGLKGSQILQVNDPKVKEGIFALGIKDKAIKLFYVGSLILLSQP